MPYLKLKKQYHLLFKIHNIYYPYALDLINKSLKAESIHFTYTNNFIFNQIMTKLATDFTIYTFDGTRNINYIIFDFHINQVGNSYDEDGMWFNEWYTFNREQMIMLLVVMLIEKNYTKLEIL